MQTNRKSISKELIINTTLSLIEDNGGIKDVNLRGIANKIGCNHTNLYNYFDNLDEIFWESLGQALLNMIDYVDSNININADNEDKLYSIILNIINFSMNHPGWYRLIWLDSLGGEPSLYVINILHKPTQSFNSAIMEASDNRISQEKASFIGSIIHSYLHGEMCKLINNRSFIQDKGEVKNMIFSNIKHMYKLLINKGLD